MVSLAASPDGSSVAAGSGSGAVWLYPADTLADPVRLDAGLTGPVGVAFSPDARRLATWGGAATASAPPSVLWWDVASQRPTGPAFGEAWPDPGGGLLADGVTLLLAQHHGEAGQPPTAVAWDLDAGTPSTAYPLPTGGLAGGLAVSPGGDFVALGVPAGTLVLAPRTGASHLVSGATGPLAVSADGRTLLTADPTGVGVWDVDAGVRRGAARTGAAPLAAAFSGDDRFASLGADSRAVVWELGTLTPAAEFAAPAGPAVRFGADGRILYTGGPGGLFAWDLSGARGVAARLAGTPPDVLACALAGRDLTEQEWRTFLPDRGYQHVCPGR